MSSDIVAWEQTDLWHHYHSPSSTQGEGKDVDEDDTDQDGDEDEDEEEESTEEESKEQVQGEDVVNDDSNPHALAMGAPEDEEEPTHNAGVPSGNAGVHTDQENELWPADSSPVIQGGLDDVPLSTSV